MPRKNLEIFSDFDEPEGTRVPKKTIVKHSVDGFDSPAGEWPIPTPIDRSKSVGFKEYKEMKATTNTKLKRSSDGFERNEARSGFSGKKRRTDSSDMNIGPLETTQKGLPNQKVEGPTWQRGQKRSKASTTASLGKGRRYFGTSHFRSDAEESPDELGNDQPTSTGQATRIRSKRRISHISEDDELSAEYLPVDVEAGEQGAHNHSAFDDAEEPLDLLVSPFDMEDESISTIPSTNTPEDEEAPAQLPPKCWVLNKQQDDLDTLTLRPDPRAWEREASVILQTSDL